MITKKYPEEDYWYKDENEQIVELKELFQVECSHRIREPDWYRKGQQQQNAEDSEDSEDEMERRMMRMGMMEDMMFEIIVMNFNA